jgi:hypothetical protein
MVGRSQNETATGRLCLADESLRRCDVFGWESRTKTAMSSDDVEVSANFPPSFPTVFYGGSAGSQNRSIHLASSLGKRGPKCTGAYRIGVISKQLLAPVAVASMSAATFYA